MTKEELMKCDGCQKEIDEKEASTCAGSLLEGDDYCFDDYFYCDDCLDEKGLCKNCREG